jgi:hypothetical protein
MNNSKTDFDVVLGEVIAGLARRRGETGYTKQEYQLVRAYLVRTFARNAVLASIVNGEFDLIVADGKLKLRVGQSVADQLRQEAGETGIKPDPIDEFLKHAELYDDSGDAPQDGDEGYGDDEDEDE